jgi:hypothetical protein
MKFPTEDEEIDFMHHSMKMDQLDSSRLELIRDQMLGLGDLEGTTFDLIVKAVDRELSKR